MDTAEIDYKNVGRNDPCPCNSGKKFEKCHGQEASYNLTPAQTAQTSSEGDATAESSQPQFDPSKMDLNWLADFSAAIQRLPKGQLNRLQTLMQKGMSGKDVARELEEFQRTLPKNVQELLQKSPAMDEQLTAAQITDPSASVELSDEQKQKLQEIQKNNSKSGFSGLWESLSQ